MKTYYLQFGSGDPRTFAGLSATFLIFKLQDGTNVTSPGITQVPTSTGIYYFTWGTTTSISFLADAATTSPGTTGRYVVGVLDPANRIDEVGSTLVAIGTTNIALGTTNFALGTTAVALGTTAVSWGSAIGATQVAEGATIVAIGNTLLGIGNTVSAIGPSLYALIGTTASLIGDNVTDPSTLFGYMKRVNELVQGQETFTKGTGVLDMYDRTGATLLNERTITNSASTVIKT